MKKFLATFLLLMLLASPAVLAAPAAADKAAAGTVQSVLSTKGKFAEVTAAKVRILGEGAQEDIVLHVTGATYILNALDGSTLSPQDLKPNDAVTAYYGPALTRSIPPQGNAVALLVGPGDGRDGMYMKAAQVDRYRDGSVKVLDSNHDRLITIYPKLCDTSKIKPGSEMIVWYQAMTLSIPAQATATKAILLAPARQAASAAKPASPAKPPADPNVSSLLPDLKIYKQAGAIVVRNKKVELGARDYIEIDGDCIMLPLRTVAEALGYKVSWNAASRRGELSNGGAMTYSFTVGSKTYGKAKSIVKLKTAPKLVNGVTLVPLEFFTDVMGLKAAIAENRV